MPKVLMLQPGWKARQEKRAIPSVANLSVILRTAVFAGRRTHVPAGSAYTASEYMGPFGKLRAGSSSGVSRFRDRLRFLRMTTLWDVTMRAYLICEARLDVTSGLWIFRAAVLARWAATTKSAEKNRSCYLRGRWVTFRLSPYCLRRRPSSP